MLPPDSQLCSDFISSGAGGLSGTVDALAEMEFFQKRTSYVDDYEEASGAAALCCAEQHVHLAPELAARAYDRLTAADGTPSFTPSMP